MRESILEEGELGFDDGFYNWLQLVTIGYMTLILGNMIDFRLWSRMDGSMYRRTDGQR